jgi:hypothetical protein
MVKRAGSGKGGPRKRRANPRASRAEVARLPRHFVVAPIFSAQVLGRRLNEIAKRAEVGRVPWRRTTGRRPMIYDQSIRTQVVSSLRLGAYLWVAAAAAGITERTLSYWMQKGRDGIEPYVQFFQEVEGAMGYARLSAETRVHRDDPKFWLRVGPGKERPGRPGWTEDVTRVEVSGPEGGPIEHEIQHQLTDDELREVAGHAADADLLGIPSEASTEADEVHPSQADS